MTPPYWQALLRRLNKEQEMRRFIILCLGCSAFFALRGVAATAQVSQLNGTGVEAGVLPRQWTPAGPKCMEVPEWQAAPYNEKLYLLVPSRWTELQETIIFSLFYRGRTMALRSGFPHSNHCA